MSKNVYFFPNGNTAFFDENGEQVPELQVSWLKLYWQFLEQHNVDLTKGIEFRLPNGYIAKPFKRDDGTHGWEIEDDNKFKTLEWERYTKRKRLGNE